MLQPKYDVTHCSFKFYAFPHCHEAAKRIYSGHAEARLCSVLFPQQGPESKDKQLLLGKQPLSLPVWLSKSSGTLHVFLTKQASLTEENINPHTLFCGSRCACARTAEVPQLGAHAHQSRLLEWACFEPGGARA